MKLKRSGVSLIGYRIIRAMKYYLTKESVLKWLEKPSVYHIGKDELYELDDASFEFLRDCSARSGGFNKEGEFIDYCLKEDILTTESISIKRPPLLKSPVPSLRYLELQITDRCNLRCGHCYINSPLAGREVKGGELSVTQIRKALTDFEEMQGLRVLVTGGEPLAHSAFAEINEMLPDFLVRKVLFTNGILLRKEILESLKVDEIQISVDGLENAHDSLRGKGTFKPAMEAVRRALDSGFVVSVSTMVHPENLADFEDMENLFLGMGIKDWTVDAPCVAGRLKDNSGFQLTPEKGGKYLRYGYGNGLHASAAGFACGLHLMSVASDGRVSKCTFYSDSASGRVEDGLRECRQRIKPVRLDELKCDCDHLESCRGGCRYRAELLGDPLGKDLYRCSHYGIIM